VTEIEGAVEEAAYGVVARAAHRLRGIGGHIGAARLADSASEVEIAARTGSRRSTTAATVIMRAELTLATTAASSLLRS
jgi:HPt (histidine-containing phosphotransfer) domain-containing protein